MTAPILTHRSLDYLMEQYRVGAMTFGSEEHNDFIVSAIEMLPALVALAREHIPGDVLAEVRIPGFLPRITLNTREHHFARAKRVKAQHNAVGMAMLAGAPKLRNKGAKVGRVVITQHTVRLLDSDNCVGALKGVRDAVAKWLGIDDGARGISWVTGQEKATRAGVGVVIRIEAHKGEPVEQPKATRAGRKA